MLKGPELLERFQGKVFKGRVRKEGSGVCGQLTVILLIGLW